MQEMHERLFFFLQEWLVIMAIIVIIITTVKKLGWAGHVAHGRGMRTLYVF
jgi:hypothetical protein